MPLQDKISHIIQQESLDNLLKFFILFFCKNVSRQSKKFYVKLVLVEDQFYGFSILPDRSPF